MSLSLHLEKLAAFNAVVKAGSIRKAATDLNVTQPALSRSIAVLESAIECRLFTRDRHGVTLTRAGAELFTFSERMLRETSMVQQRLIHGDEDLETSFVIGTYDSIAIYFFPAFLKHVASTQKKATMNLLTAPSRTLMRDLKAGSVDLIVSVNPEPSRAIVSHELFRDHYGFFKAHDGNGDTLICFASATDLSGKSLEAYAETFGFRKDRILHCESFETVRALTEEGLGIGMMPTRVAERGVRRGDLERAALKARVPQTFGEHVIAFSYLKSREGDSGIQWVYREMARHLTALSTRR